jgi:hypothetical protein
MQKTILVIEDVELRVQFAWFYCWNPEFIIWKSGEFQGKYFSTSALVDEEDWSN